MTIVQLLKNARGTTICFRKLKKYCHGVYEFTENNGNAKDAVISIDLLKRTDPARVFLHELLHRTYLDRSEYAILALERHMWTHSSQRERYLLYRTLFMRKWRTRTF